MSHNHNLWLVFFNCHHLGIILYGFCILVRSWMFTLSFYKTLQLVHFSYFTSKWCLKFLLPKRLIDMYLLFMSREHLLLSSFSSSLVTILFMIRPTNHIMCWRLVSWLVGWTNFIFLQAFSSTFNSKMLCTHFSCNQVTNTS